MKKYLPFAFLFATIISSAVSGQDAKYLAAMQRAVSMTDTSTTLESKRSAIMAFERIAASQPKQWLPQYYMGWLHVMMSMQVKINSEKDAMLDKALELTDKADSLSRDNSEVYTLRSFALSMKIAVDPSRGQTLGIEAGIAADHAIRLDPENPRPYLIKGQGAMYTPVQYGGGKEEALLLIEKSIEKFQNRPADPLLPHWGEKRANEVLNELKNMD